MDPKHLTAIERWNLTFAVIFTAGAALFFDRAMALGVAVGALIGCTNFWSIHKLIAKSLRSTGTRRAVLQILLGAKMILLLVAVFLAIRFLPLSPVGLAFGLSVFLLSIAVVSLRFALTQDQGATGGGTDRGEGVDNGRA